LSQKNTEKTNTEYIDIIESTPRNTAAAIAFATDDILIVTPSDHIIDDIEAYETAIQAVEKASEGFIVTLELLPQSRKQVMAT
jgi:mannose-1-phosphate guanylyltransferase